MGGFTRDISVALSANDKIVASGTNDHVYVFQLHVERILDQAGRIGPKMCQTNILFITVYKIKI